MKVTISGFYDEYSGSLKEQLNIISNLEERYLCPRGIDGKSIASFSYEEFVTDIKPKLDEKDIKFSSIGSPIGKVSITDDEGYGVQLHKLKELIKIAECMECKYIRIFSFFMPRGEDPAKYRDDVMKKLQGFLDLVKDSSVILLHENEKHIYGDIPERCLDIYKTLNNPKLQLIYDASNFIQCKVDALDAYNMLKDYAVYYHIKDCDKETRVEVPLGFGDGHYKEIFADLNKRGYEGFMTLEPHTQKYAILRQPIYFIPFMPLVLNKFFKAFRKIDKKLQKGIFSKATKEEVYLLQYSNLVSLLTEVENG